MREALGKVYKAESLLAELTGAAVAAALAK
jgi:hypothetical protein